MGDIKVSKIILKPSDWECTLAKCPPGLFVFNGEVCFKTEYRGSGGHSEAYCSSGEAFWGGQKHKADVDNLKVIPAYYEVDEG